MTRHRVVAFTAPAQGHINRLLPVVAGLCERGVTVDFFGPEMARTRIEQTGARFVNLYARRDRDVPDGESHPLPVRNVSFAGYWADDVVREVAPLRPDLILHDTDAVIGRVVAYHLKRPRIAMRAGHTPEPDRIHADLLARNKFHIAEPCWDAVRRLRERHGLPDATPFSCFTDTGADLNICSEPPEFLPPDCRGPLEPLAFYGSYWPEAASASPAASHPFGPDAAGLLRVYAAFGTAAWIEDPNRIRQLLTAIADALAADPAMRGVISLGNPRAAGQDLERLRRPNVRVEPYVDQIDILRHASVIITHNGLNSTHEAIFQGVPMISYPLRHDQPGLATLCQQLGIAIPLDGSPPTVADVRRALDRLKAEGPALRARLTQARAWEQSVIEQRPAVLERIIALMS